MELKVLKCDYHYFVDKFFINISCLDVSDLHRQARTHLDILYGPLKRCVRVSADFIVIPFPEK